MKISNHISYKEATKSQQAVRHNIKNEPNEEQLNNMKQVAMKCFEPLREHHGKPIAISSFFRSPELNKKIGGSITSDHCKGMAIDIDADIFDNGMSNKEMFEWLKNNVEFDQLISEYPDENGNPRWVHISYRTKNTNRNQSLIAEKIGKKTIYKFA